MTIATALTVAALAALSACGSDSAGTTAPDPTASSTAGSTATADPQGSAAIALRGDWQIQDEQYVLHLLDDGTFTEDFQGVTGFRTGTYEVDDSTISLVGGDGNTDEGTIGDDTIEFTLGTATRVE